MHDVIIFATRIFYKFSDFLLLLLLPESLVIKSSVQIGHTVQDQPIYSDLSCFICLIIIVVHYSMYEMSKNFFLKNGTSFIFDHTA